MPRPTSSGVALRIYLADGTPQGLRIAERLGWTGLCLAFARADYEAVRQRPELQRTGVYLLTGPDPLDTRVARAYVGEADAVRSRLDAHYRDRDFWTEAFVLTTTDDSLNKAQVRYLESRLIALAHEAAIARLDNGTAPEPTWLSEPDTAVMDAYLNYTLDLLPVLGVEVFEIIEDVGPPADAASDHKHETQDAGPEIAARPRLFLRTVLTDAEGRDDPRGFVVLEGATARRQENVMHAGYQQLRRRLIEDGTLSAHGAEQYRLTRNYLFDSPSAAASVLAGGSKNGRTEWKDRDGRPLRELEEQAVKLPPRPGAQPALDSLAITTTGADSQEVHGSQ